MDVRQLADRMVRAATAAVPDQAWLSAMQVMLDTGEYHLAIVDANDAIAEFGESLPADLADALGDYRDTLTDAHDKALLRLPARAS